MILSKRLEYISSFVDNNSYIADIGSDHGYLPYYLLEKNIIVEWFERCKHAFKFRIKKAELNKVQELLDDKYSEYNMSQKQLVKLNIIGYGIIQDNKVLMQTMNILKEHNVNILNVNLSQARIEIVADEIENSLVELLHKKLIKKGE